MPDRPIIATELLKGQGLGNQLFLYVAIRCLALENNCDFAILNKEILANNIHSNKGMYFMDLDCGLEISKEYFKNTYHEKEDRIYIGNSLHDINHGCYITGVDGKLFNINEPTLVYGNLQAEAYFGKYKQQIKQWLKVKPEYDNYDYSRENLCVINIRGGEYTSNPELFLRRKYWLDAMKVMKSKRADMEFIVVTDDLSAARRSLPEVEAHHFDLAGDYTVIKNAHYLILSNSTFAYFPAITSDTLKYAIAPKYWARHNVSDGYWAAEQNIYSDFEYLDRNGKLYTAEECKKELEEYKKTSKKYKRVGKKLTGLQLLSAKLNVKRLIYWDLFIRMLRSLKRRFMEMVVTR
jgi:hypothetical protein